MGVAKATGRAYDNARGARGQRHAPVTRWCGAPKIGSGVAAAPLLPPLWALIVYPHLPEGLLLKARRCAPGWLSVQPSLQARASALGSPVIGCSALGARAYGTEATPLVDGDTLAASAIRSWGEMCPPGGYPYRGARRDLSQQLGRTRARKWAGSTGRAGRSNDGGRLAFLLCTLMLLVCWGARNYVRRRSRC